MRLAGHIQRHEDEISHDLLFWEPKNGRRGRGRPHVNNIDMLKQDTELEDVAEARSLMSYRVLWRERVKDRARHSKFKSRVGKKKREFIVFHLLYFHSPFTKIKFLLSYF